MMINILFWVAVFSGGLLLILMILSLVGGLDIDIDVESGSTDTDTDAGGIGLVKGFLTFLSTSSWVIKILVATQQNIWLSVAIGVGVGIVCFYLLNFIFKLLLKNDSNVNWQIEDALFQRGKVYLKIPASNKNSGLVQVEINGAIRQLKARSKNELEIKTGDMIRVMDINGEYVIVEKDTL